MLITFFQLFLAIANGTSSLPKSDLQFKNFGVRDGLPGNNVTCLLQDHNDFIWVGTESGLCRFDGYTFTTFSTNISIDNSISENNILSIFEDRNKYIWIGTTHSIERFDETSSSFKKFNNETGPSADIRAQSFVQDYTGKLLVGTDLHGLMEFDSTLGQFIISPINYLNGDTLGFIRYVFLASNKELWLSRAGYGVYKISSDRKKSTFYPMNQSREFSNLLIREIDEDNFGNIIIANYGNGVCVYNREADDFDCDELIWRGHESAYHYPFSMATDQFNQLWITTEDGLLMTNRNDNNKNFYHHEMANPTSLVNGKLRSILIDRQQNLWIGHYNGGLSFSNFNNQKPFINFTTNVGSPPLTYNYIHAFAFDKLGQLWTGSDGGGIDILDIKKNKKQNLSHQSGTKNSLPNNTILSLFKSSNGDMFIGTYLGGLVKVNGINGKISILHPNTKDPTNSVSNDIRSILEDKEQNIWVATNGGGIYILNKKSNTFKHVPDDIATNHGWLQNMIIDKTGNIWVGANKGISVFDEKAGKFKFFPTPQYENGRYLFSEVNSLAVNADNEIIISTPNKVLIFNRPNEKYRILSEKEGIYAINICATLQDDSLNYWISTFKGIYKYQPKTDQLFHFNYSDGLICNQFINNAAIKAPNGDLFFGGVEGMVKFSPALITVSKFNPKTWITELEVNNNLVNSRTKIGGYYPIDTILLDCKKIILHHIHRFITFRFSAMDYIMPENIIYRYKLEGFNNNWTYTTVINRSANYTNLPPGNYTFVVNATNSDGIWSTDYTKIKLHVIPPFYKTFWFWAMIFVLFMGSVLVGYKYRIREIKRINLDLEKRVSDRTNELRKQNDLLEEQTDALNNTNALLEERQQLVEEQAEELLSQRDKLDELNRTKDKFFSIIAHDLKNPFNVILGFLDMLKSNFNEWPTSKTEYVIDLLDQSSKNVYNLLENLLNWSRSQRGIMPFDPRELQLHELVDETFSLLNEAAEKKKITLSNSLNPKSIKVFADLNMMQSILRNLVTNGIKFTKPGGAISVTGIMEPNGVLIAVRDNGVGMTETLLESLFKITNQHSSEGTENEQGTGLGLILVNEFVNRHSGQIKVSSTVNVGTEFKILFPKAK